MVNEIVDGKDINNIFNSFFYDGDENENIKKLLIHIMKDYANLFLK